MSVRDKIITRHITKQVAGQAKVPYWIAVREHVKPGEWVGHGATEAEAVADLKQAENR